MSNNKRARMVTSVRRYLLTAAALTGLHLCASAQANDWIRRDSTVWGARNGIVVGLWPAAIENLKQGANGGPRGLFRIGYEYMGLVYHINYMAVEPVVNGRIEFSEISPSASDGKWGKLMWVSDTFNTPDAVGMYVQIEQFANGAHPYLKLSIFRNRPEEVCIEVFHHPDSAPMERCGITATMGNYSRLRKLYLKDSVVNARALYAGFDGIDFIEKSPYPADRMRRGKNGDWIVAATPDESFAELAAWPQQPAYLMRWNWRYRPFYMLTQYWRKEKKDADASLQVRVNGRAKYWNGGGNDPKHYIDIPGGPSFENFELRERYVPGQRFYFGLSRKTAEELLSL
ncbi:hypothetical protein EGT74_16845 [Chitinophaga lutea]|uniref:Uncharacterized protein n=1 Tax=Chitinophaga lutea TaxID=2488634 RepID=A0A3N4PJ51_9BACT|nr:hypothetical protein [Chitinophaga lutea]RPE08703.1 hypothetical protein EGT74_16845 [Chitinophaga lutea]